MDIAQIEVRDAVFEKYYIVDNLLTSRHIKQLEKSLQDVPYQEATTVSNDIEDDYRKSSIKWIPFENSLVYDRIWKYANIANDELWGFDILGFKDSAQYTMYQAPFGKYDYHLDINGVGINHRKISLICPLNDGYEGGEIEFKTGRESHTISLKAGQAVYFPSFYLHRVLPVTKGERRSLVQWISGAPYK